MTDTGARGIRHRLVLTRREGESIEIMAGEHVITVRHVGRNPHGGVMLAVEAVPEVRIVRSELKPKEAA